MSLRGLRLPVLPGEKRTTLLNWSAPDLAQPVIPEGANIALRLDHVVDIDCDCPEAIAMAPSLLPHTACRFGRPTGVSHYLFEAPGSKPEVFRDEDGNIIIEIRTGAQHYTVIPPSRVARKDAPTIDTLAFVDEGDPSPADAASLRDMVRYVAAAVVLARHWPKHGRHDLAKHAAGFLGRQKLNARAVEEIVVAAASYRRDDEMDDRKRVVRDTCAKLAGGHAVTGGPELAKIIGDPAMKALATIFGVTPEHERPRELRLTTADTIQPRAVQWVWQDRMPASSLGLLAGREGLGKSMVAYTHAADLTRGRLPGIHFGVPKTVAIAATEDSWEHTIAPRLIAADANLSKVGRIDVITTDDVHAELSLPQDLVALERLVRERDVAMIILDPLISRLAGKLDTHKDAEVRRALEPLVKLADNTRTVVLGIIHLNKSQTRDPLNMLMGSRAFSAVARFVLFVAADPDDDETRLLGQAKNNLGRSNLPTLSFVIEDQVIARTDDGEEIHTGQLRWTGEDDRSIRDVVREPADGERQSKNKAGEWLLAYLVARKGAAESSAVKRDAEGAGHSATTLKRARKAANVTAHAVGRTTWWLLPGASVPLLGAEGEEPLPEDLPEGGTRWGQ